MINRTTCCICLSKINKLNFFNDSKSGRQLLCKHVFHRSCIDMLHKPQCPLCCNPIFTDDEEKLLSCKTEKDIIAILKNIHDLDINTKTILNFLINNPNVLKYEQVLELMLKYCDLTDILADNLNNKQIVHKIVNQGKVNWFKTFNGGLTFNDLVKEKTNDEEIISLIYSKLPVTKYKRKAPSIPNIHTYQEQDLTEIPLNSSESNTNLQRTATIRRSLREYYNYFDESHSDTFSHSDRSSRSDKSSYSDTFSHSDRSSRSDRFQSYPIFERLYPVLPSAPPYE